MLLIEIFGIFLLYVSPVSPVPNLDGICHILWKESLSKTHPGLLSVVGKSVTGNT